MAERFGGCLQSQSSGSPQPVQRSGLDGGRPPDKASTQISGTQIWNAYSLVNYDVWQGEENRDEVWRFIGGNVGKSFAGQNTCATRLSYALNYGGVPIATADGRTSFFNSPRIKYKGKRGDGKNYIVGAGPMSKHLASMLGKPDALLSTAAEAQAFSLSLTGDQVGLFAGQHHSGGIKKGYADPYLFSDPAVLPVDAWKLS